MFLVAARKQLSSDIATAFEQKLRSCEYYRQLQIQQFTCLNYSKTIQLRSYRQVIHNTCLIPKRTWINKAQKLLVNCLI